MLYGGAAYEVLCMLAFIIALVGIQRAWLRDRDRAETLISILVVGLFFGLTWEPEGIGLVWNYHSFRVYAFMGIPIAILLSWAWWMILCRLISERMMRVSNRIRRKGNRGLISMVTFFMSGFLVALVIEPLSVYLDWWSYLAIGERAVLVFPLLGVRFSLAVVLGWGVLTAINLTFSEWAADSMATGVMRRLGVGHIYALVISSALIGSISGWFSWQIVALIAALIENESPRLFFTRDHVVKIEMLTAAQQLAIVLTSISGLYLWKKTRRREEL